MYGKRKVLRVEVLDPDPLKARVLACFPSRDDSDAADKDFYLVQMAIFTDRTVVSLDEAARKLFQRASTTCGELRQIHWANPGLAQEGVVAWLAAGAVPDPERLLTQRDA